MLVGGQLQGKITHVINNILTAFKQQIHPRMSGWLLFNAIWGIFQLCYIRWDDNDIRFAL